MDKVLYETRGHVAYVTINRPERLNACDFETYQMLEDAWQRVADDSVIRAAIFTGMGERAFSAGSDIKEDYVDTGDGRHAAQGKADDEATFSGLASLRKPIIAAINGHANGGGLEQALACDIRVAAEHAQFGLGEVRLGWLPGGGGTQRLPRLIPQGRALEMLYTGNRIDAREALRLGLVDHVVPMVGLMAKAEAIAEEICKSAPLGVQRIKEVALAGLDLPLREGLRLEKEGFNYLMQTEDSVEGALAFAEKREPNWKGK